MSDPHARPRTVQAQPGTRDVLPDDAGAWRHVESAAHEACRRWGFSEIRTPVFEATELFERGVGGSSDIVQKEMYTFEDRSGRRVTLRPEGTAPVVRAFVEHAMGAQAGQTKLYYLGPMFRAERPQEGRLRQFHQLGIEVFGAAEAGADADGIALWVELARRLGIEGTTLHLNSIGDAACRPAYLDALRAFFAGRLPRLCDDCRRRFETNVLRLLDCKKDACRREGEAAPRTVDALCPACAEHFAEVRSLLGGTGIAHREAPRLVRGFDYYTRTVFEVTSDRLGAQDAICGGGRYDGLVETLGGSPTPGFGWAAGLDRMLLALRKQAKLPPRDRVEVYVAPLGASAEARAFSLALDLRGAGISVEVEYRRRSVKAQLRSANDLGARVAVIVGEREIAEGVAAVKTMAGASKGQENVPFDRVAGRVRELLDAA